MKTVSYENMRFFPLFIDCHNDSIATDDIKTDGLVKFVCSEMMVEQRWTHITLVWAKGMLKNSAVTLYINGKQIAVQKVNIFLAISRMTSIIVAPLYQQYDCCPRK